MGDKELKVTLDYLEKLSNEDFESLKKKVYKAFSQFSFLLMEARAANFKRGWLSDLTDHRGPLFSSKDARVIETFFRKMNDSSLYNNDLDNVFKKIKHHLNDIDEKSRELSREFGLFRFSNDKQFKIPFTIPVGDSTIKIKVPENSKTVFVFINLIIESISIIYSFAPNLSNQLIPFILGLIDILKGDWKEGFVAIAGFANDTAMATLIAKVFHSLLNITIPNLEIPYRSMLPAFCLWGFANFSPESERTLINDQLGSSVDSPIRAFSSSEIQELKNIQTNISVIQLIAASLK